jgi:hypothetical protein
VIKRDADLIYGRPRWHIARSLFAAAERGDVVILASTLVQAEVMGHGDVRGAASSSRAQRLVSDWFLSDYIEWCDVDRLITRRADFLLSNDNGFLRAHGETVDGVRVIKPQIVWQETLEDTAEA